MLLLRLSWFQPKRLEDMKEFLVCTRKADTRFVTIKKGKNGGPTKFKCRTKKYLYTLVMPDEDKAKKLRESLPNGKQLFSLKKQSIQHRRTETVVELDTTQGRRDQNCTKSESFISSPLPLQQYLPTKLFPLPLTYRTRYFYPTLQHPRPAGLKVNVV